MLTPNIQDELRARLKLLTMPIMDDNSDMEEIIAHVIDANNIVAASFLQEGLILQAKMIMAYGGFLGAMGMIIEPEVPPSKFITKLLKKKVHDEPQ